MISVILGFYQSFQTTSQRCHPKASELLLALPLLPLGTSMESDRIVLLNWKSRPTAAETEVFLPKVSTCRGLGRTGVHGTTCKDNVFGPGVGHFLEAEIVPPWGGCLVSYGPAWIHHQLCYHSSPATLQYIFSMQCSRQATELPRSSQGQLRD